VKRKYWIVARTKSNQEYWAGDQIENQGYEFCLPEVYNEKKKRKELAFRGFIFVKTDGLWAWLLGTKGIYDVIKTGSEPSKMPLRQMRELRKALDTEYEQLRATWKEAHTFKVGERVNVLAGAFRDFKDCKYLGDVVLPKSEDNLDWGKVEVMIFGRPTTLTIKLEDLEKSNGKR
jgi:transcription antitermination factor NusG